MIITLFHGKLKISGISVSRVKFEVTSQAVNQPINTPINPLLIITINDSITNRRLISFPFNPSVLIMPISFVLSIIVEYEDESNPKIQIKTVVIAIKVKRVSKMKKDDCCCATILCKSIIS